jgi:iduronate 2-sulfatase
LIQSPNIDKLASEGVLFGNSFCNVPVCGASRASLMTGARPTRNRFLSYFTQSDVEAPEAICLSQHFKNNGYYTISNGKIFHNLNDREESWDENWRPKTTAGWRDYHINENVTMELNGGGPPYENAEVEDTAYHDGKLAEKTIADLKRLKENGKPFFLASGFVKPHLPFNAPTKYWDLYSKNNFQPTQKEFWPQNAPKQAFHNSGELRWYGNIPEKGFVDDSMSVMLQYGYYACVSYVDAQIGKVLAALEELGLAENTVVILWGDHGWNLGDHGMWCKHCNFNTSLQTPMIIKAPNKSVGAKTLAMTEFVDIFPTLCDLCDLEIPETVEGKSLVPLLENPQAEWTDYVICKYFDGLTIRTPEYAYTEWRNDNDSLISNMLYNHKNNSDETDNIANKAENKLLVKELSEKMLANRGVNYFKTNAPSPR